MAMIRCLGAGMIVWLAASSASVSANQPPTYAISVLVQNDAPVPGWQLRAAEEETARVFAEMGVTLHWLDTYIAAGTGVPEVSIVLMSREMGTHKAKSDRIAETTLATSSRRTGRSYIFCDRVGAVASRHALNESMILARTLTHELGHMIANIGHDVLGVMREALEPTEAGFLAFTDLQKRAIRDALAAAMTTDAPRLALRLDPDLGR